MTFLVMTAGFLVIPNLSAFLQMNLGYPRAELGLLYLYGGVVTFFTTQATGRAVDRFGSFRVGTIGTLCLALVVLTGFAVSPPLLPVTAIFIAFMLSMSLRNVAYNTLTSRVPSPAERARFMSIQSAVGHTATTSGAFLSSQLLTELPDLKLVGMNHVAFISIALTLTLPFMLYAVESTVLRRDKLQAALLHPSPNPAQPAA